MFFWVAFMGADHGWAEGSAASINQATPLHWTAAQDHQNMMDQLGIKSLRRGADGFHTNSPYYENTDEAKANPYPALPDPLTLNNGKPVTSAAMWWKLRRPEIVRAFESEMYGSVPSRVPPVRWQVLSSVKSHEGALPVLVENCVGRVDHASCPSIQVDLPMTLTLPAQSIGRVPVIIHFAFGQPSFQWGMGNPAESVHGRHWGNFNGGVNWQQLVLSNGWGCAELFPTVYQEDDGSGLTRGIIGLCNHGQPRRPGDWGALRAWAWGASRVLDFLSADPRVDARQIGIEGLSRFGKAALVTMAFDQRFAIALIGSSGEGGAKLSRRNWGELVENLTGTGEYHWMAGGFLKYGGPLTPGDLPVDAHELIALCAPRPVFISYGASGGKPGSEGPWLDQHGSFMAAVAAGPVYRLLGRKDLGVGDDYLTAPMPPLNTGLLDGDLAWRQHDGGHTDGPNWPYFLAWANRYIHAPPIYAGGLK